VHYHTVRKLFSALMLLADRTSGGSDTSPEPFPPAVFFWKKVEEEYRRENWVIPGTRRTRPIKRRLVLNYYYIVTSVQSNLAKDCVAMPLPVGGGSRPSPNIWFLGSTRVCFPNRLSIGSSVCARYIGPHDSRRRWRQTAHSQD